MILALLVIAMIALRLYFTPERLTPLVSNLVDGVLAGKFEIRRVEWSLPLSVIAEDVTMEAPGGGRVLHARHVEGRLDPLPLLFGVVRVGSATVDEVDLVLAPSATPAARYAFVEAFKPAKTSTTPGGSTPLVLIEDIEARDVDLILKDPTIDLSVRGATISDGRFSLRGSTVRTSGDVELPRGEATVLYPRTLGLGELSASVEDVSVTVTPTTAGESGVAITRALVMLGKAGPIEVKGSIGDMLSPNVMIDLTGKSRVPLEHRAVAEFLRPALASALEPKGLVDVVARVHGPAQNTVISFEGSGDNLMLAGQPVDTLSAKGSFGTTEIVLEDARISLLGGGALIDGSIGGEKPLSIALENFPLRQVGARWTDPGFLPERATGSLSLRGPRLLELDAAVEADLSIRGLPDRAPKNLPDPANIALSAKITPKTAQISRLEVSGRGVYVSAKGDASLDPNGAIDLTLRAKHDHPTALLMLPPYLRIGSASLEGRATGSWKSLQARGTAAADSVRVTGLPAFDVRSPFELQLEKGAWIALQNAVLTSTAGELRGLGTVTFPGRELDLTVESGTIAIAHFTNKYAKGTARVRGTVRGRFDQLQGDATIDLFSWSILGLPFEPTSARVRFDRGRVSVAPFVLSLPETGHARIAGHYDTEDRSFALRAGASRLPLDRLEAISETPLGLGGHVSITATASGTIDDPRFEAQIGSDDLSVSELSLGFLGASLSGDKERIFGTVALQGPSGRLELAGAIEPQNKAVSAQISAKGLAVERMPFADRIGVPIEGKLDLNIAAGGSLPYPALTGSVAADGLTIAGRKLEPRLVLLLEPTARRGAYRVNLRAGSQVRSQGVIDLAGEPFADVFVELSELDLVQFWPELREYGVGAKSTGTVSLVYRRRDGSIRGELDLRRLDLRAKNQTLSLERPTSIRYDGKTMRFERLALRGPLGRLAIDGAYGDEMHFDADGDLDLAAIAPLIPALAQAEGRVRFAASAAGSPKQPELSGEVVLSEEVRIRPRAALREVILSGGKLSFQDDRLVIDKLEGKISSGVFEVGGSVRLKGLVPAEWALDFQALNLPFRYGDAVLESNAEIHLVGSNDSPRLYGYLEIIRGRYQKRFKLQNFIFVAQEEETSAPLAEQMPWLRDLELDLKVISSGAMDLKVDAGTLAVSMSLGADLSIGGTAAEPRIEGRVSADRGDIEFPRAELEIVRCAVDFDADDETTLDATIDLLAEGEVQAPDPSEPSGRANVEVAMTLDGELKQMRLDLSSKPPLDRLEILSLLVTGYANLSDVARGAGEDSGTVDTALAFAGAQLTGPVSSFVEDQLERALNFQVRLGAEVSSSGFRVTASKEVTRRLTIEGAYAQTFAEASRITTTARALLQLFNQTFLEASTERTTGEVDATRPATNSRLQLKYRVVGE